MGSEAIEKVGRGDKKRKEIMVVVFGIFLLFFFVSEEKLTEIELPGAMHQMTNRDQNTGNGGTNIGTLSMKLPTQAKCNVVLKSKEAGASDKEWTTKPIWLNMYPDTINEKVHKRLINQLTGTKAGGKSYYASSKGTLRHCIGNTQTVTCSNIHPRVPFREGQLDEKLEKGVFYDKYIMMVRNPMFGLFVGYNAKAQKYSGLVGQGPEEDWKKLRDEYFESMVDDWKDLFVSWRKTKYNVGMYLVYEDLFRYSTGPDTLQTLVSFLRNAGFGVIIGDGGGDGNRNGNGNGNGNGRSDTATGASNANASIQNSNNEKIVGMGIKRKRDEPDYRSGEDWARKMTTKPKSILQAIRTTQDFFSERIDFKSDYYRSLKEEALSGTGKIGSGPSFGVSVNDIQEERSFVGGFLTSLWNMMGHILPLDKDETEAMFREHQQQQQKAMNNASSASSSSNKEALTTAPAQPKDYSAAAMAMAVVENDSAPNQEQAKQVFLTAFEHNNDTLI